MNYIQNPPSYCDDPPIYSPTTCQPSPTPVIYHINRHNPSEYTIQSENGALEFSVEVGSRSLSKPDMTIYRGGRECGQKVVECTYGESRSSSRCDTGYLKRKEPSHHLGGRMNVAWWTRSIQDNAAQYRFAAMVQSNESSVKSPRTFSWMKSSSLMLVDEETSSVVAVVSPSRHGDDSLEVIASLGDDFPLIVLSTYLVLSEKEGCSRWAESLQVSSGGKVGDFLRVLKRRSA